MCKLFFTKTKYHQVYDKLLKVYGINVYSKLRLKSLYLDSPTGWVFLLHIL